MLKFIILFLIITTFHQNRWVFIRFPTIPEAKKCVELFSGKYRLRIANQKQKDNDGGGGSNREKKSYSGSSRGGHRDGERTNGYSTEAENTAFGTKIVSAKHMRQNKPTNGYCTEAEESDFGAKKVNGRHSRHKGSSRGGLSNNGQRKNGNFTDGEDDSDYEARDFIKFKNQSKLIEQHQNRKIIQGEDYKN